MGIQQNLLMQFTTSAFSPVTRTYASQSGTEIVPSGASFVAISVWAAGGSSGAGAANSTGGGGGYGTKSGIAVSGGQTFSYVAGANPTGSAGDDIDGANSSVTGLGSLSGTVITTNGGKAAPGGSSAGAGGAAGTGGTTNNAGLTGTGGVSGVGGHSGDPSGGAGGTTPAVSAGGFPGGGGGGYGPNNGVGQSIGHGGDGQVQFAYT